MYVDTRTFVLNRKKKSEVLVGFEMMLGSTWFRVFVAFQITAIFVWIGIVTIEDTNDVVKQKLNSLEKIQIPRLRLNQASRTQVVPTVIALASGYNLRAYQRFVGSLRATQYEGNIILGISPTLSSESRQYLESQNVTLFEVHLVPCTYQNYTDEQYNQRQKCAAPYPHWKIQWGRYALIRDWLNGCKECQGPILLTDARDVYFQRDPFQDEPRGETIHGLHVFEESPLVRTTQWLVDWPVKDCKGLQLDEPMLCSGTTLGTRDAVMKYLHRMAREFDNWVQDPKCRFATIGDDQSIHNYLFYTGQLPYATAIPHRSGIVHTVGIEGSNLYQDHVAYWKTKGKDQGYANSQPYQTATDKTWIQSELVDDYGFFTNMDGTRSRVVHQYDRFGPPLERWLSQSPVRSTPTKALRPRITLYYHVGMFGVWETIVREQLAIVATMTYDWSLTITYNGGGIQSLKTIVAEVLGEPEEPIRFIESSELPWEGVAVKTVKEDCERKPDDSIVFYFHSKGVTKGTNTNVRWWRKYMEWFTIQNPKWCVEALQNGSLTCGVDLRYYSEWHYSGNFWAASCRHIRWIQHTVGPYYTGAEMWLLAGINDTTPHVALYDSKRNMYNTPLLPSEYKSRTTPQLRVHIWDDGNPYKKRERLLNIEGVSSHPNTSLVETPNEADIILWISTRSADETPPTNFSNVVVLDYSDGWDLHQKRSLLKGEKAYLKRSWVERDDGQFQRVGPGATQGAMPLFYGAASANVRPFTPHASKKHSIVNVLRDEGADHNRNRKRVTQWTQFFVTKHNVTDAAIGPMSTGWAGSDWDSTYMNHLASARIIVTCNPNNWVGDFRLWESMVSGAMVMVDRMYVMELLPHPLINKLHYVVYDSSNRTEFIELLEYYISRPDVTERIARAGYEWTLAHHMPRHRVDYILNNINLSSGSSSGTLAPTLL